MSTAFTVGKRNLNRDAAANAGMMNSKYYRFEWAIMFNAMISKLSITEQTKTQAEERLAYALNMTKPNLRRWLRTQGYILSITESTKPRTK